MSVVCAWCHVVLSAEQGGPVTHGICRDCATDLQFVPKAFDQFLNTLPGPVLAVDAEGRVLGANAAAEGMVSLDAAEAGGDLLGDVLSCVFATLPGGCGRTLHCSGCQIRRAFEHTYTTGEAVRNAPAFAHRRGFEGPVPVAYLISTERLGPLVLVQVEEMPADSQGSAPA